MKGMFAILGCLFAAYAAPLFANEVPLILDETIQLPFVPENWDILGTDSENYLWAIARIDDEDSLEVQLTGMEMPISLERRSEYQTISDVYLYLSDPEQVHVGVVLEFVEYHGGHVSVREYAPNDSFELTYTCDFFGRECSIGPPGLHAYCEPEMGIISISPPAPAENQISRLFLTETECYHNVVNGVPFGDRSQRLRLSSPNSGGDCWSPRQDGFKACAEYQSESIQLIAYHTFRSWWFGFEGSSTSGVGMGYFESDTLRAVRWVEGEAGGTACTRDVESGRGVLFASGFGSSGAYLEGDSSGLFWQLNGAYSLTLAADIAWSLNEEFLCFNSLTSSFDVVEAMVGQIWGQTSPLDSGYAEMKIIGRYHNETRRLVVRYGSELRIYRFGDPIYTDADDSRPELPSELTLSAYPNPFNPTTLLTFDLPASSEVELHVYDLNGRLVKTLVDQRLSAGSHDIGFDGASLPSGIYFARISADDMVQTRKLVLLK